MDDDLLKDYQEFVDEVSSDATKNIDDFGAVSYTHLTLPTKA